MATFQAQLDNIAAYIQLVDSNISNITGNTISNFNQVTKFIPQQSNIYNIIYYGLGNVTSGNCIINGNANINGNLLMNSPALYIDTLNNRIGINNRNPQQVLDIIDNANINGNALIRNNIGIGSTSASANADIVGNARISGNVNIGNGLLWSNNSTNYNGILNTNPQYELDVKGNANISGNLLIYGGSNIGNLLLNSYYYNFFTVNNSLTTFTLPSSISKVNFIQRQQTSSVVSSTSYNALRITYTVNCTIMIIVRINGYLRMGTGLSTGLIQENRILLVSTNTGSNTSTSSVSNGTPIISSVGSSVWTSCNMSVDTTTALQTTINITPIFSGTPSLSNSCIVYDWTMIVTNNNTNSYNISTVQTYSTI